MSAKAAAFSDVEASYVAFRDLITMLPDSAYAETVAGDWDLSRILAHMAGWYRELSPEFARIVAGTATPATAWADVDAWNARFAANAKQGMAALDDFDEAFHEFYAAAKGTPDEAFEPRADGSPAGCLALFRNLSLAHTTEHRTAIEAWLGRR